MSAHHRGPSAGASPPAPCARTPADDRLRWTEATLRGLARAVAALRERLRALATPPPAVSAEDQALLDGLRAELDLVERERARLAVQLGRLRPPGRPPRGVGARPSGGQRAVPLLASERTPGQIAPPGRAARPRGRSRALRGPQAVDTERGRVGEFTHVRLIARSAGRTRSLGRAARFVRGSSVLSRPVNLT